MFKPKRELARGDVVVVLNARYCDREETNNLKVRYVGKEFVVVKSERVNRVLIVYLLSGLIDGQFKSTNVYWHRGQLAWTGKRSNAVPA